MKESPSISVALCTWNGEAFVRDQLRSILSQSVRPDEVVVCDDGSSDRTLEVLEEPRPTSPTRIRIVRRGPNLGISKNFEAAILAAKGEIVFLSDQDDVWNPRKIERMTAAFAQDPRVGLVYCDAHVVRADRGPTHRTVFSQRPHLCKPESWPLSRLIRGTWIKGCTMALRSWLVPALVPFATGWYYDHWIGFAAAATSQVACVNEPLMDYRRHGSNASDDPFSQSTVASVQEHVFTTRTPNCYWSDVIRWEAAVDRLANVISGRLAIPYVAEKAPAVLERSQRRLEFALNRHHLHALPRPSRIASIAASIIKGEYHGYVGGWGSALRDLFCR